MEGFRVILRIEAGATRLELGSRLVQGVLPNFEILNFVVGTKNLRGLTCLHDAIVSVTDICLGSETSSINSMRFTLQVR